MMKPKAKSPPPPKLLLLLSLFYLKLSLLSTWKLLFLCLYMLVFNVLQTLLNKSSAFLNQAMVEGSALHLRDHFVISTTEFELIKNHRQYKLRDLLTGKRSREWLFTGHVKLPDLFLDLLGRILLQIPHVSQLSCSWLKKQPLTFV